MGLDLESDPLAKGYVKSLARPGGNFTGVFLDLPELSGKQVGLLKEIVPRLSRLAIFGIPDLNAAQFAATETAVRALRLEAEIMEVRVADDFEQAFEAARTRHVEAGVLLSSPLVFNYSKQLGALALGKRLPAICLFAEFPKSGGVISYGPNVAAIWQRGAGYVGKILDGAKPSDLPIQRPEDVLRFRTQPEDRRGAGRYRTIRAPRHRRRGDRMNARDVAVWPIASVRAVKRYVRSWMRSGSAQRGGDRRTSSGSLAMLAAMRRASSRVSKLAAVRRPGSLSKYT